MGCVLQSSRSCGLNWQINQWPFSNEVTRSRTGLFMTAHLEGTSDSAARGSAVVLISVSRVPWKTKGKRQNLFL
jgi:hypothetical protein